MTVIDVRAETEIDIEVDVVEASLLDAGFRKVSRLQAKVDGIVGRESGEDVSGGG